MKLVLRKLGWLVAEDFMQRRSERAIPFWFPKDFQRTKSIFVHVPRTGGTSIGLTLYDRQIPHTTWKTWVELFPRRCRNYYTFAAVRDPNEKFLSAYDFLKRGGMNQGDERWAAGQLAEFKKVEDLIEAMADQEVRKRIYSRWHFVPQSAYVDAGPGRPGINLLIPFEHLAEGFEVAAQALGRDVRLPDRKSVV